MNNFPFLLQAAVSYMSVSYWRGLALIKQMTAMIMKVGVFILGVPKKVSIYIQSCSRLQFTVSEFIWIKHICKFCLVYHLKDFGASR